MDLRTRLAARVAEIAPFHVMEVQTAARALEAQGRSIVHMEIGEPDFPTPAPVVAAAQRAIADGRLYYTSALGLPALREAIAQHYLDHYDVDVSPERVIDTVQAPVTYTVGFCPAAGTCPTSANSTEAAHTLVSLAII